MECQTKKDWDRVEHLLYIKNSYFHGLWHEFRLCFLMLKNVISTFVGWMVEETVER